MLFRGSKNYEGIKKSCLEYAENIKMTEDSTAPLFQQTKKFGKNRKGRQDRRAMQASRKPSFDEDETAQASAEAGGTSVLQVWKEGQLRITV